MDDAAFNRISEKNIERLRTALAKAGCEVKRGAWGLPWRAQFEEFRQGNDSVVIAPEGGEVGVEDEPHQGEIAELKAQVGAVSRGLEEVKDQLG